MGARDRLLARWLRKEGLTDRVTSAAGVDAEPARNPSFHPDARLLPPRGPALVLALREQPKTWVRRLPAPTDIKTD
jgi:hypothetical protein